MEQCHLELAEAILLDSENLGEVFFLRFCVGI